VAENERVAGKDPGRKRRDAGAVRERRVRPEGTQFKMKKRPKIIGNRRGRSEQAEEAKKKKKRKGRYKEGKTFT